MDLTSTIQICGLAILISIAAPTGVHAEDSHMVVAEGEQFTPVDKEGWRVTHQDDSYGSHTYGGMWVSQGGLLGASVSSVDAVAVTSVTIPAAGKYRVWSKYQSPPYFNYMHKIEVVQNRKTVFSHVFGMLDAPRFYSFSGAYKLKPIKQCWWAWGGDHDAAEAPATLCQLVAGKAEIRLVTVKQDEPAGDPMVDAVILTTNPDDTYKGWQPYQTGSPFALDTLAQTKLFMRFLNGTEAPAQLTVKRQGHFQPIYGGASTTIPAGPVAAGQWSDWYNIGPFCRLVHDEGLWMLLKGAEKVHVQFARDANGEDRVGDVEVKQGAAVVVPIDITWNRERKVVSSEEHARRIIGKCRSTWRTANGGKKPQQILYYGAFRGKESFVDPLKDALGYNTLLPDAYDHVTIDGYHQHCPNTSEIVKYAQSLSEPDRKKFRVCSFGDEIHLGQIKWNAPEQQEHFRVWLKKKGLKEADLGMPLAQAKLADRATNTRISWYATMFNEEVQFARFRDMTAVAKREFGPQVETGANYSPHIMPQYYGPIYQWIDIFKHNGMTMYWAEDYVFSVPQPPQFLSWMFATVRCAVKYNQQKIHFYIMPHAPGQIPAYLRRGMVFAVGAGADHIDNFWVAPAEGFTENYVGWQYDDMFQVLHEAIYDSAEAEALQVKGVPRQARVAILLSKATDHNERNTPLEKARDPFMAMCENAPDADDRWSQPTICRREQQLLYLANKHSQRLVDLITEEDVLEGRLKEYAVLYVAGEWIDHRVPSVLKPWIKKGGMLYACAGLGHKNEFNEPDDGMADILGLKSSTLTQNVYCVRPFLELPLVKPIDEIVMGENRIPAIAMRQELVPDSATVLGQWTDGKPAVTVNALGKGKAYAVGTAAGHTYYKTGLKRQPWARGGRKTIYNPTGFDAAARSLACLAIDALTEPREVTCSNPYVEALLLDSSEGTLMTLINWDNAPIHDLEVTLKMPRKPTAVRSVQQQKAITGWTYADGSLTVKVDLEWADYIMLPTR